MFVHAGPYETFGQTLQEALASGVPVVAVEAGGPRDLVRHGYNGLLVTPFRAAGFSAAIDSLAADPTLRKEYGANARASVEQRTWAAVGDELIGHYNAVLAPSTVDASPIVT